MVGFGEPDEQRDTMMVGLLKRGLRGDKRHQFTARELRKRDPWAHDRLMERAEREIASEDAATPDAMKERGSWHYLRRVPRSDFPDFRSWALWLWNEFDLWTLRDPEVELTGVRLFGYEFEKY